MPERPFEAMHESLVDFTDSAELQSLLQRAGWTMEEYWAELNRRLTSLEPPFEWTRDQD